MQITISENNKLIENQHYTGNRSAKEIHEDGRKVGTFRTATVLVDGNQLIFRNCVFENNAGPGHLAGQAIALYLDGDDIVLENCVLKGNQDTLFLAPLPEKELIPGGFLGPKQHTPRTPRKFMFRNCRIEGGVDFIFGGAEALFEECEFYNTEPGYVFAPSTPQGQKKGFTALNCRFTCAPDVPDHSCYIARPWRNYAKVTIENCWLGRHIHPEGWNDWDKLEAHNTVEFIEINSTGPGSIQIQRPDYVQMKSC